MGSSTRGGCRALHAGRASVCWLPWPSDAFIEQESEVWLKSIKRVFSSMTDVPEAEIDEALRSPQLALFLFQFSDYASGDRLVRPKEKVL